MNNNRNVKNLYKPGSTKHLESRMKTYQTGSQDELELEYIYKTDNVKEVEGCLKAWTQKYQYEHSKEIYHVDLSILKNIINGCGKIGLKLVRKNKIKQMDGGGCYFVVLDKERKETRYS